MRSLNNWRSEYNFNSAETSERGGVDAYLLLKI
jgi:hypothetical protein